MQPIAANISAAAAALRAGRLVAFPTETVYGLGADAANPAAIAALYRAKRRPPAHPVIVHLPSIDMAGAWAAPLSFAAQTLARRFMPGPLTLLLPRAAPLPHLPGGDLIALRVPAHPMAQDLLRAFGGGVAAPSANRFGRISPTTAEHVRQEFPNHSIQILDGGACSIGIESTIVAFLPQAPNQARILRPGHISAQDIAACGIAVAAENADAPAAPGALPRHYAPTTPLKLAAPEQINDILAARLAAGQVTALLSAHRPPAATNTSVVIWRQAAQAPRQYAQELYHHLRALDATPATMLLVAPPPATPAWAAITDRLQKSAGKG